MNWQKLGKLYECDNLHPKLRSHAANPLPVYLEGNIYRIYFSARDDSNRSSVGAVDLDIINQKVICEHRKPKFIHGDEGSFYSHGVSIGNIYTVEGKKYMLFMGWKNSPGKHWHGEIGRLRVNNDLSLELDSSKPLMALDSHDPVSLSYPWVLQKEHGYTMWYGSTLSWDAGNGEMLHVIKYADSIDGHIWTKHDFPVPYIIGKYQAFSRPTVIQDNDRKYTMWFSYRSGDGTAYRIGHATSPCGKLWNIKVPNDDITASETGWDSQMIEYPYVFNHDGRQYLLYNGNGYGKSGFGLAIRNEN